MSVRVAFLSLLVPKLQLGHAPCPRSSSFVERGYETARRLRWRPDEAELRRQARDQAGAWSRGGIVVVGLALVCLSGEFFQIAAERVMEAEWRTAESESVAAGERLRRRQQLILAARGGRMPMAGAVARLIALAMLPLCFCWFVAEYVDAVRTFVIEKEMPVPPLLARESIHYPRRALHVSIANDGGISLDNHLMATADDLGLGKLADALKDRRQAVDAEHLVLHVASEATCQRLIDLLSLAARLHLPVVIDDADSEEPQRVYRN